MVLGVPGAAESRPRIGRDRVAPDGTGGGNCRQGTEECGRSICAVPERCAHHNPNQRWLTFVHTHAKGIVAWASSS